MESLPPEISLKIFTRACCDGGFTGRSLAQVSRTIHSASAPARYHSIQACGPRQIRGLLVLFQQLGEQHGPVHHLFLTEQSTERFVEYSFLDQIMPSSVSEWAPQTRWTQGMTKLKAKIAPSRAEKKIREANIVVMDDVLTRLLEIVAPTLLTLVLIVTTKPRFLLAPTSLPCLEELTLHRRECFRRWIFDEGPWSTPSNDRYPALRRLHLITEPLMLDDRPEEDMLAMALATPNLTHLRLTDIIHLESRLPCAMTAWTATSSDKLARPPIVFVKSGPRSYWDYHGGCTRSYLGLKHVAGEVSKIARLSGDQDCLGRLHVIETKRGNNWSGLDDGGYTLTNAVDDWIDRMEGGEGCWKGGRPIEECLLTE